MERYEATKAAYDNIIAQIAEKNKRVQRMQTFIKNVQELGVITEFDEELWGVLVESVTVYSKDDIRVSQTCCAVHRAHSTQTAHACDDQ